MSYKIRQGEDLLLELIVLNEDNVKVDMTTTTKIRVELSIKNLTAFKYLDTPREAAIAGYGDVSLNGTNNYQLDISLTRIQSKTFPVGTITAYVLLEFPSATLEYNFEIGVMEKGSLKGEDLSV